MDGFVRLLPLPLLLLLLVSECIPGKRIIVIPSVCNKTYNAMGNAGADISHFALKTDGWIVNAVL